MSCSFGERIKITIFGQSHSEAMGVVVDGLPAGFELDLEKIQNFLNRRAPGRNSMSTSRAEADKFNIVSGLVNGVTCGAPLCAIIENTNQRSGDYDKLKALPRPSHSDFAAYMKHNGFNDIRGGGNFSGRLTAPLCFAGAVIMQMLEKKCVHIGAHIKRIARIDDESFNPVTVNEFDFSAVSAKELPVINDECGEKMKAAVLEAKANGDSVGGIIECAVIGLDAGFGEPIFGGIENKISSAIFGIPAVKGIEFGSGFAGCDLFGSENNDDFIVENEKIKTATNNHGGILGGITSGMPVIFRCGIKPTPSIVKEQQTVNLASGESEALVIDGRHDPCIVQRAVPCVEAAAAIALADYIL